MYLEKKFDDVEEELDYLKATEEDVDVVLERHQSIRHLEKLFDEHDVSHDVRGVVGNVAESSNKIAETNDADRIVISGGDRSPAGKAIFGSTA
jgi:nucleotide-binding universal stress UspA family protein